MTNGEKLKEVFPDIQIFNIVENEQQEKFIHIRLKDVCQAIELEWWNAEYKEPTLDKPHIKGDYYDGFKNGLRTAKWRYDKMKTEIEKAIFEESIFGFYDKTVIKILRLDPKVVFEIIDKYKAESEVKDGKNN